MPWHFSNWYNFYNFNNNSSPTAVADFYDVGEDSIITFNVLSNDYDANGDAFEVYTANGSLIAVGDNIALASGAIVTYLGGGSFSYDSVGVHDALSDGETETDTFQYQIRDSRGYSSANAQVSITVLGTNDGPMATIAASDTFAENSVNETPQLLDGDVILTDPEGNFDGGTVTVSQLLAEDTVAIRNQGTEAGQIGVSGSDVTFGGTVIGTFAGGNGTMLTVTLNAAATSEAVQALIRNFTYSNSSDTPTASRTLIVNVTDASGADLGLAPVTGTFTAASTSPFSGINVGFNAVPTFIDLDGDGDLDLVVGEYYGTLKSFRNDGGSYVELTGVDNPLGAIDTGYYSAPAAVDIDGDGDHDLVIGKGLGGFLTVRNNGDGTFTELTGTNNPLNGMDADYLVRPTFGDIDADGDVDMVVGNGEGSVRTYLNDGAGSFVEQIGAANPFDGLDVGTYAAPVLVDLDGDGDLDMVVGDELSESLRSFRNNGDGSFSELTGADDPFGSLDVDYNATPAFVDLDGDGDLDLVTGEYSGGLLAFDNDTPRGQAIIVNVTAENDAPTVTDPSQSAAPIAEDVDGANQSVNGHFGGSFADVDGDGLAGVAIVANGSSEATGQWEYFNGSAWISVGLVSQSAALLLHSGMGLRFSPALDFNGEAPTLTAHLVDTSGAPFTNPPGVVDLSGLGATGGTTRYSAETVSLSQTVTAVNDEPAGGDNMVTMDEDGTYIFAAADFGFSDLADNDDFAGVVLTTLPASGDLYLDGTAIDLAGTFVTAAQILAGDLSYKPDANGNGDDYATFTFQVRDAGGTAGGGQNTDQTPNTITIDVTPVNDAAVVDLNGAGAGADNTATYIEQAPVVTLAADLVLTDDGGTLTGATVQITAGFVPLAGDGADYLGIAGSGSGTIGGISYSYSALTGVLTLSGSATVADYQALLRQVSFQSTTNDPGTSRTISWTVTDGALQSTVVETTITVTPVNDAPVLVLADTTVSGTEDENLVFSAANGNAITVSDKDSVTLTVTLSVASGTLTLAQTTGLTVTGDGTGSVEVSGSADDINDALEGLVYRGNLNYEGADTLSIEIDDGTATDTDSIAVTLADDGTTDGDSGDNVVNGASDRDIFRLEGGGNDTANGGGGVDTFYFGAAFTAGDTVDGGADFDVIGLQGDYSAGVTFGTGTTSNITDVESISLYSGTNPVFGDTSGNLYSYNLTTVDGNVGAGGLLKVNGAHLTAGENFTFDGSAETDGSFFVYGGLGVDQITGGAQNDNFVFAHDGRFGAGDTVIGGGGYDVIFLRGDYAIDFNAVGFAGSMSGVESIGLLSATSTLHAGGGDGEFDYSLTWNDGLLSDTGTLVVNGSRLTATETMDFDGSQEVGGKFRLFGGAADDVLRGGGGDDLIFGNLGADTLQGGGGADVFRYISIQDSTVDGRDGIQDFSVEDVIDLSGIDANGNTVKNDAFEFIGSGQFTGEAGQLRAVQTAGPIWTVSGDTDGDGNADFEVLVVVADQSHLLGAADFIM